MAGKDFTLRATPAAVAAIERLRGTARKSYAAFEAELRKRGCQVAGYRLLGAEGGYSEYCCKRLVGDWRVIATFEPGIAIVIAVGLHDSRAFYAELSKKLAIRAVGQGARRSRLAAGKAVGPASGWRLPWLDDRESRCHAATVTRSISTGPGMGSSCATSDSM